MPADGFVADVFMQRDGVARDFPEKGKRSPQFLVAKSRLRSSSTPLVRRIVPVPSHVDMHRAQSAGESLSSERRLHELTQPLSIPLHVINGNFPVAHPRPPESLERSAPIRDAASTVPANAHDAGFIGVSVGAMDLCEQLAKSRKHI